MLLRILYSSPTLTIAHDTTNDWLFADWQGDLTLPVVRAGCLELARCCLRRVYPRVLTSNMQVSGVDWEVAPWLAYHFLPTLNLAGVEHLAWVSAPSLRGLDLVHSLAELAGEAAISLFADMEQAVAWLQHAPRLSRFPTGGRPPCPTERRRLLTQLQEIPVAKSQLTPPEGRGPCTHF